jgi:phosphotransferase system IIB component
MSNNKTVAETILQQLGGQRFIVMTGARNFMSNSERERGSLTFKLPRQMTRGGITHVRITLNAQDTYNMEGLKVRGVNCSTEREMFGIHAENLQQAFTAMTGLDTHL